MLNRWYINKVWELYTMYINKVWELYTMYDSNAEDEDEEIAQPSSIQ
jgi:hypothetical protein